MALETVVTSKGKPAILYENFMYRLKKETASSKLWQCVNKNCTGKITTDLETLEILHGSLDHNHDSDKKKTQVHLLRQACKRKAQEDLTERPRKILITEAEKVDTEFISQDSINKVRKAMWRQRKKIHPTLPKTRQEALSTISGIQPKRPTTVIDTDVEHELAWMYSISSVEYIKDAQLLFGDGTFKSAPNSFTKYTQFLVLKTDTTYQLSFSCCQANQRLFWKFCLWYHSRGTCGWTVGPVPGLSTEDIHAQFIVVSPNSLGKQQL